MSILLQNASRFLIKIMLLLSVLLVIRGHNFPGGGFIGALVAISGIALYTLAFGLKASGFDRWSPRIIAIGMVCILIALAYPLYIGQPPLTGIWFKYNILGTPIKFGTTLIFDFGIYFIIIGSLSWLIAELEDYLI